MKQGKGFRLLPSVERRDALKKQGKQLYGLTYRRYLREIVLAGIKKGVTFPSPSKEKKPATRESRIELDKKERAEMEKLAKLSGRTPAEWALMLLDDPEKILKD